jgi:hypothetical protein
MAGAAAKAGATEKTAKTLKNRAIRPRDCDCLCVGSTHARNPLPRDGFAA